MEVDNPVSGEFLSRYPVEAARVLEHLSPEDVAALFSALASATIVPAVVAMLPNVAAVCLEKMEALPAAKLLIEIPVSHSALIYRQLSSAKQEELSEFLPTKVKSQIHRFLDYAPLSAGDLMEHTVTMLPGELTVADAIRRIGHIRHAIGCDIYVVDNGRRLMGVIDVGRLLTSKHQTRLRDMIARKAQSVSVHTNLEKLLSHPGWTKQYKLPVVERDNILLGVLDYTRLKEAAGERAINAYDPLDNLLSLAGLYWLSLMQLLDGMLGIAHTKRGE